MFLEKYKPNSLSEVVSQKSFIGKVQAWLENWKKGKALLIYGPSGTGKTVIPKLVAKEMGKHVFEINATQNRNSSHLKEILNGASKQKSLLGERLIFIEDVDNMGRADRGGIAEIIKVVKESEFPVIMTAKDAYDPKIRNLRNYCTLLKITKIRKDIIRKEIEKISEMENLGLNAEIIKSISEYAGGDLRSAINDLHAASNEFEIGYRENKVDIFETIRTIFKSKDFNEVRRSIQNCEKNDEEVLWWLEQSIPEEYQHPEEIALAFDFLSKADLYNKKIFETRNFRFKRYVIDMIAAVSLAKKDTYKKFVSYRPPDRLIVLGRTKAMRNKVNGFYEEMGTLLHCSKRKVREQDAYLRIILGEIYPKFS